jgi:uncharacterized protein
MVDGPAGRIEALLEEPEDREPLEVAVVCHPHPRHGGTMHNKVVYRIARGLRRLGATVLRFNFRGVHLSEGTYDQGEGEVEDARAALDYVLGRYPGLPFSLAGFSFGSRVALRLGCSRGDTARVIAVGFPSVYHDKDPIGLCGVLKIFIQSTGDEYGPSQDLFEYYGRLREPKQLIWVDARDHFFSGALGEFEEAVYRIGPAVTPRRAGVLAPPAG